ncbi:MAG: hypothetical protein IRZ05_20695 [Micromonosporaceae bacterium]|nr:hypothetical protein [Micromonosporaceae bacterium]
MHVMAALIQVYPVIMDRAVRYAALVTGDADDGRDACHDVILRLLTNPPALTPDVDNVGGLLWVAVRNRVLDIQRYHGRRQHVTIRSEWLGTAAVRGDRRLTPEALIERGTPEDATIAHETQREVRATLARLRPMYRDTLIRHYWQGESAVEPTFKTRLQRGRTQFRREWERRAA